MTEYNPYIIDFFVTYNNGAPSTTVLTQPLPQPPSSSNVKTSLEELYTFIQTYGLTIQSFTLINGQLEKILSNYKSSSKSSSDIIEQFDKTKTSASSKDLLLQNINTLISMIKEDTTTTTYTTPDMETTTGTPPAIVGNLRTKRTTGHTNVTKFQGLGDKVKNLQTDMNKLSTNYSTFVSKVKNAFSSDNSNSNTTNNSKIVTSQNSNNVNNTSGQAAPGIPNNFINNVAMMLVGNRKLGTLNGSKRNRNGGKINTGVLSNDLETFQVNAPQTMSNTTASVNTQNVQTDYYEISSSYSSQTGLLNIIYSYYQAGSQTSIFACTFSLTLPSLSSLSSVAYYKSINESNQVKNKLVENAGYIGSTSPTNQDLWISYLIWLFSYLSTGVSSQLGFGNIIPFPQITNNSVNYMFDYDYMQKVGNFGLTVQQSTMNSDNAAMLGVSIPSIWPSLMYSFDPTKKHGSQEQYMGSAVVNIVNKYTSTS